MTRARQGMRYSLLAARKNRIAEYFSFFDFRTDVLLLREGRRIGKTIEIKMLSFETRVNKLLGHLFQDSSAEAASSSKVYAGDVKNNSKVKDGDWAYNSLAAAGHPGGDKVRDEAERFVPFYMRRRLKGSPNVLRWLLELV